MVDVGISVGIVPDTSGERVVTRSLQNIGGESRKAQAEAQKLANAEELLAASTMKAQAASKSASAALMQAANAMAAAELKAKRITQQQDEFTRSVQKTNSILETGKTLIATYFGVQSVKALRDTAMSAEALRYRMAAAVADFGDAGQALKFVREESERLGLNFKDTAGSFAGFAASALRAGLSMKDVKDIFTGTSEAIRALKLDEQQANSVFLALEQMAGKGTVQMQELKLQLGSALPGAIEIFAKAMGKTPAQFYRMVEAGEVTIDSLKTMGKAFHDEFGEAAVSAAQSATAETARFQNALYDLGDQVGNNTGLLDAYKDSLHGISEIMKGDLAKDAIPLLRDAVYSIREAFDAVSTFIGFAFVGTVNNVKLAINEALSAFNLLKQKSNDLFGTSFSQTTLLSTSSNYDLLNDAASGYSSRMDTNYKRYQELANPIDKPIKPDTAGFTQDNGPSSAQLRQATKQQRELQSAIGNSRTEMEKLNDEMAHLEKLKGVAKTAQEVELLNRGIRNTQSEIDKLKLKTELNSPLAKNFKAVADEIQDGFKDAFKSAFNGGGSLFQKFADGIKATFKSLLLDLAYQAAIKPILVSVLGVGASALGLSSAAQAKILGTSGSSSGGFSLGGASSLSSLLSGGLYSKTLAGIGGGIGNLLSGQSWGAMGPSYGASIGSGAFGNLGYGALGGLGASLFGLGNKNPFVNMATGTLGSLAGGAVGTSLGSILGMSGGPVGAVIGGFLGTALGGLFGGGKPSDKVQYGGLNLSNLSKFTVGGMTGKKYSQENATFRDSVLNEASNLAKLFQSVGGKTSGKFFINVGSRDGLRLSNGEGLPAVNYGNNSAAFIAAVMDKVVKGTTGLNDTFKQILKVTGVKNTKTLADNFAFGQQYLDTLKSPAELLTEAVKGVNDQFQALIDKAKALGLPLDEYTKALDKQKEAAVGALKAQAAGFGSLADMTAAFNNFFTGQALSDASSLTPMQKFQTAQSSFGDLLTKAQGGDLSVTPDLLNAANTLISQGRNVYASSTDFSNLEGFVRSSVQGIANQTGYTGQNVSYSIVSTNQQLVQSNNTQTQAIQDMKAEIFRLSNMITVLTSKVA